MSDSSTISHASTKGWQLAVCSGILGWLLDAFDFFILVFLFDSIAQQFRVSKESVVYTLTLTLAMRPLGALLFGAIADRFGRKLPLIACVLYFSTMTVCSGLAPGFGFFVVSRALYGLGMGGYWGIGASYAMESAPVRLRGLLSGMMQSGYPMGYLFAAIAVQFVSIEHGWRIFFFLGAPVAVLIAVLTWWAPESRAWESQKLGSVSAIVTGVVAHKQLFLYLLMLMSVMLCLSHGTQDLFPDFLKSLPHVMQQHVFGMRALYGVPVLYNLAAVAGAWVFGAFSERVGRRFAIMAALVVCLAAIGPWAYGTSLGVLVLGSCLMQAGGQGAFGVIPAHMNELSPAPLRGLFPGFVYQLGVLVASPATMLEIWMRNRQGYRLALAEFTAGVILGLLLLVYFGPEAKGRDFNPASDA